MTQDEAIRVLRDALAHAESVYRLNVVKDGESSSTLENMQAALRATATITVDTQADTTPSPAQAQPNMRADFEQRWLDEQESVTPAETEAAWSAWQIAAQAQASGWEVAVKPWERRLPDILTQCSEAQVSAAKDAEIADWRALATRMAATEQVHDLPTLTEALAAIDRFTKAEHPYSSATAIERGEARKQLDALGERIVAVQEAQGHWGPITDFLATRTAGSATPIAPPEFSLDPDGEIALDWYVGENVLSVSSGAKGVSFACTIDGKEYSGSRKFEAGSATPVAQEPVVPSFDCSLASTDAYDPQSFIDGAKWAQEKLSGRATPSTAVAEGVDTDLPGLLQMHRHCEAWEVESVEERIATIAVQAGLDTEALQNDIADALLAEQVAIVQEQQKKIQALESALATQPAEGLTHEQRATIEEAAQVLESAAKHNSEQGRTVFANSQQDRANRLRAILAQQAKKGSDHA